ncbi:MAG TPA: hypothetical protein VN721_03155, partial [Flavipsychrobacter sp.]|nr:hypothetical protein [Flavipsychrobacter sp.]
IMSLRDIKQQTTQGENIEMMMNFITYVNKTDHDFAKQIVDFAGEYLKGKSVIGFQPYQIECDAISPYNDEDRKNPQSTGTFTLKSRNKPETDPQSTGNESETPEIK